MWRHGLVLVAAGVFALACTQPEPTTDEPTPASPTTAPTSTTPHITTGEEPKKPYGGTVVLVDVGDVEEIRAERSAVRLFAEGRFDWHIRRWEIDRWVPGLITEIPSFENGLVRLNDDGSMTIRYLIHPEAVWEDGVPVTGADFAFTYQVIVENLDELDELSEGSGFFQKMAVAWGSTEVVDPEDFVVEDKAFEYTLPDVEGGSVRAAMINWNRLFGMVVPKHQVGDTDLTEWLEEQADWYSAGPWHGQQAAPVSVGESGYPETIQARNDRYWVTDSETGQRLPLWDTKRTIFLPDADQAWEYFLATPDADWISHSVTSDTIDDIIANDLVVVPRGGVFEQIAFYFGPDRFEANSESLVGHLAFRQAMAHALDRDRIAQEVYGGRIDAIDSYVTVFSPSHSGDAWSPYDYDPIKARELLATLCKELDRDCQQEPPTLTLSSSSDQPWRPAAAMLVEEMLEAVGIDVTLNIDHERIGDALGEDWEAALFAWRNDGGGLDPLLDLHELFESPITGWHHPDNPPSPSGDRYPEILNEMGATLDDAEVTPLILEAEQILADEVVFIPLFPMGFADFWKPGRIVGPETEVLATEYRGSWETFHRTDLGDGARYEP